MSLLNYVAKILRGVNFSKYFTHINCWAFENNLIKKKYDLNVIFIVQERKLSLPLQHQKKQLYYKTV